MLKPKSFFSLVFALSLTLSSAATYAASESTFPNFLSFTSWLSQHAAFECPGDPETADLMIKPIAQILYTGLQNIENINPELLLYKINESAHRKVLITCVPPEKTRFWGGLYDPTPIFMDNTAIRFSHFGNLILIPEDRIKKLISEDVRSQNQPAEKSLTLGWFIQAKKDSALYEKVAILHEFLHFLQFDNNQPTDHIDVGVLDSKIKVDDDMVYSCTEITYPFSTLWGGPDGGKISLRKSCYMCAMGKGNDGKVRVDESRSSTAASACSSIPVEIQKQ